jgi:hypothetical protein
MLLGAFSGSSELPSICCTPAAPPAETPVRHLVSNHAPPFCLLLLNGSVITELGVDVPEQGIMKILDAKLADDGTLHGFAMSRRGRQYRWFVWSNGSLSVFREEQESQWPGATHWSSLWGHLSEFPVRAAIRAAVAEMSRADQPKTAAA